MRHATVCCSLLVLALVTGVALGTVQAPAEVVTTRHASGRVHSESRFRNGLLDGTSRGWYASGARAYERSFVAGREHGTHRGWYESGAPHFVLHYSNGLSEGEQRRWYPSGQLRTVFHHHAGHEVGQQQLWNPDGSIHSNYVLRDGKRYGLLGAMGCTGKDRTSDGATP
jgi:antitoxin component YwqK of YwqJK toxin-antitoxin module